MKSSLLKKVVLIFMSGMILLVIEACFGGCSCPPIRKDFFDFQSVDIEMPQSTFATGERVEIPMRVDDVEFLVEGGGMKEENSVCYRPWFINSAFACSCIEDGGEGLKFPVTDIRIFSDSDYSDEIEAGELLNDIIKVKVPFIEREMWLTDVRDVNKLFSVFSDFILFVETRPTVETTHILTIEMVKNNGEIIIVETNAITWL